MEDKCSKAIFVYRFLAFSSLAALKKQDFFFFFFFYNMLFEWLTKLFFFTQEWWGAHCHKYKAVRASVIGANHFLCILMSATRVDVSSQTTVKPTQAGAVPGVLTPHRAVIAAHDFNRRQSIFMSSCFILSNSTRVAPFPWRYARTRISKRAAHASNECAGWRR